MVVLRGTIVLQRFRWGVLGIALYASFASQLVNQSPPPLMPLIMKEFVITHAEAGLIMTLSSLPALFAIPFGILCDRFGAKCFGIAAILSVVLSSVIVAVSSSYFLVLVGRLVSGIGLYSVNVVALAVVPQWFPAFELGTAMGIFGVGLPIAVIVSFNLIGRFGIAYGWRFAFYIGAVVNLVVLGLFWCFIRPGPRMNVSEDEGVKKISFREAFMNVELWKVGLFWVLFMGAWTAYATWTPTLLTELKGLDLATAGSLSSIPMITSLLTMPFLGWFSDRLRSKKALLLTGSGLMTVAFLIIPHIQGLALVAAFVVMGVGFALVPPTVFSLGAEALGPKLAGTSFGIIIMCSGVGSGAGALIIGFVQDIIHSPPSSFVAMAIIEGLAIATVFSIHFGAVQLRDNIDPSSNSVKRQTA